MSTSVVCDRLEHRRHFAAAAAASPVPVALDPDYEFTYAAIQAKVGDKFRVFEAVPARGGRTFLLADRGEHFMQAHIGTEALLTVIAVTADGKPDPTFGDGGVALTGRVIEYLDKPGRLAVDGAGRVYFADSTRVIRLRADGSTDKSFGNHGAAGFATSDKPVLLNDLVPTDDGGVLIATTSTRKNVQHFAVQKVLRKVTTVLDAKHNGGLQFDVNGKYDDIAPGTAQFGSAGGRIVLARVETDGREIPFRGPDAEPGDTTVGTSRQDVVLTTFDGNGDHATDVATRELKFDSETVPTGLGTTDYRYPNHGAVLVNKSGRQVVLQTTQEILRFGLNNHTFQRAGLPGTYTSATVNLTPDRRLLADGGVGVIVENYDEHENAITQLDHFLPGGQHDPAYPAGGFVVRQGNYAAGTDNIVDQIFLDASGRLNFLTTGTITGNADPTDLTLRRLRAAVDA